jgi:hypothetical protein
MRAPDGPRPNLWALGAAKLDESGSLARIYDEEAAEFLRACESYRERRHLRFLSATDYLRVLLSLGYHRPGALSAGNR